MKVNVSSTKLKGTVLFTVVSVLMVLIVILLGTLALAATASNRAYQSYQKEQTEYTARALLDSVVTAINTDRTTDGIKSKVFGLGGEGDSIEVIVERDDTDINGAAVQHIDTVRITKMKSRFNYYESIDPTTNEPYGWVECRVYNLEAVSSKSKADTVYNVLLIDEPVTHIEESDPAASFVSIGSAIFPDGGIITGGTSAGLDNATDDGFDFPPIQNTYKIETNSFFRGNLVINNKGSFLFLRKKSHVAVTGDLAYGNDLLWEFHPEFNWGEEVTSYEEIPCVYVGGRFYNTQSVKWDVKNQKGEGGQPVNLYCGSVELDKPESFSMTGDIYAFDEDKTSKIVTTQRSSLYKWASKNITFHEQNSGGSYEFGSFYSAGSARFAVDAGEMQIGGDLRIAKNLNCDKNVTVGGDVVVGDTLTIANGATLTVNGDLYASTLSNFGNIICSGNIYVFTVNSQGTCNKGEIVPANTAGMTPKTKTVTITNMTLSGVSAETPYTYEYSYVENVKEGSETTSKNVYATVQIPEINGVMGPYWFNPTPEYATVQDAVMALDQNYQKLVEMMNTQGQPQVVRTFDISLLYKQPIYPEGFDKATILNELLDVPNTYDPDRYTNEMEGYPQTLDAFRDKFGMAEDAPVYTSSQVVNDFGGVVESNCIIDFGNSSWTPTAKCRNLYINAKGKTLNVVIRGNADFRNGSSIIINESGGGTVNLFIDKDSSLGLKTVASMLTTDIIKQFEGHAYNTEGFNDAAFFNDAYFVNGDFSRPNGGDFGFTSMKSDWYFKQKGDQLYPNVFLFAGENSKMIVSDGSSALSVNVRAPLLYFEYKSSGQVLNKSLFYIDDNGTREYKPTDEVRYVSMIGQLIAGEIEVSNYFGLIYATDEDRPHGNSGDGDLPEYYTTIYYDYH